MSYIKCQNMDYRQFTRILKRNGWVETRMSGDHHIFTKDGKHISINEKPNAMVMLRLIKENNLNVNA